MIVKCWQGTTCQTFHYQLAYCYSYFCTLSLVNIQDFVKCHHCLCRFHSSVCCLSLKKCLFLSFNCFVPVFPCRSAPDPALLIYSLIPASCMSLIQRPRGYTGGGSVTVSPGVLNPWAWIFANLCSSVSVACVEREWGLPPLPTAGPGLHLLLWEEDSAGGAGEGLHVLQACKETKEWRSWESQFSFYHTALTAAQWPLLAVSGSITNLIRSVLSGMDKTCRTPPEILSF